MPDFSHRQAVYDMPCQDPPGVPVVDEPPRGVLDGENLVFNTLRPYTAGTVAVQINGEPCTDFIENGWTKLTFGVPPHPDDHITVDYTARGVV